MGKRYVVTHVPHFIGQRLVYPDRGADSIVELPAGVRPGRWLKEAIEAQAIQTEASEKYKARHNGPGVGAGNWIVENTDDGSRASVVFKKDEGDAKAKAEAEAARLNAGGEIDLGVTDGALSSAQGDLAASTNPGELPDA